MDKVCFIISRIGGDDTPERKISDEKLNHFFKPMLDELGYEPIRADQEETPGSISRSIVERIINSEMVIADISDQNPNVFYEIAIRNAVKKPIIIIRSPDQKPPFDIQDKRAIAVDMSKPDIWRPAMGKLKKQIESAEENPSNASESILSDFTFSIESETKEDTESKLLRTVKDMQGQLRRISKDVKPKPHLELDLPTFDTSTLIDLKFPNHVKCHKCNFDIPSSILYGTIGGNKQQTAVCPNCNHIDMYMENEYFYKESET